MIYKLILQDQVDGLARRSWILKPPATVGRDPNSSVCIEHDSISRNHCQFTLNFEEALVVKDAGSTNGIYVDDQRVQHAILMPGQVVQIGALRFQIEFSSEDELVKAQANKSQGSLYATQPMKTFRPLEPVPAKPAEKSWWRKLLSD